MSTIGAVRRDGNTTWHVERSTRTRDGVTWVQARCSCTITPHFKGQRVLRPFVHRLPAPQVPVEDRCGRGGCSHGWADADAEEAQRIREEQEAEEHAAAVAQDEEDQRLADYEHELAVAHYLDEDW